MLRSRDGGSRTFHPVEGHDDTVLRLTDVKVYYGERAIRVGTKGEVRAVDGASLTLGLRSSVGLVGESGCGSRASGAASSAWPR